MIAGTAALEEMSRLARVERSKGRVVNRFIERFFEDGEFELRLDMPSGWLLVDLACLVAYMREYIGSMGGSGSGVALVEVFPWTSRMSVSYVAKIDSMPESMQERQALLGELYRRLDLVVSMHNEWTTEGAEAALREMYLGDESSEVGVKAKAGVFELVVRGVYTDVERLGMRWAALASTLNTQVASVLPDGWHVCRKAVECETAG